MQEGCGRGREADVFPRSKTQACSANPSDRSGWSFETEARFLQAILTTLAPAYAEQVES